MKKRNNGTDDEGRTLALFFSVDTRYNSFRPFAYPVAVDAARKVRGIDMWNGFDVQDLQIAGYGFDSSNTGQRKVGNPDVRYHERLSVDVRDAERMLRTLRTVTKRLEQLHFQYGSATFGGMVARFAEALGAKEVVLRKKDTSASSYDDMDLRFWRPGEAAWAIDRIIAEWTEAGKKKDEAPATTEESR